MRQCALLILDRTNADVLDWVARDQGWMVVRTFDVPRSGVREVLEEIQPLAAGGAVHALVIGTLQLPSTRVVEVLRAWDEWAEAAGAAQVLAWMAAARDADHSERVRASLLKAKSEGRRLGRPRAFIPVEAVLEMRRSGASIRAIARATGLGVGTIQRFLAANAPADQAEGR